MLYNKTITAPWFVWPIAFLGGTGVAAGSLGYAPLGRINILWVLLIWAVLPLFGSLLSLASAVLGATRPWLFRWGRAALQWSPTPRQRWRMFWLLQLVWCVLGLGMFCGYWILLLFSDLAFGWSSTLLDDAGTATGWFRGFAWPWSAVWPSAVPSADMVAATRYQRIAPEAGDTALAGAWWRYLMAALVTYNLLPRTLLALGFYARWRLSDTPALTVSTASPSQVDTGDPEPLREESLAHWRDAPLASWETGSGGARYRFGDESWQADEQELAKATAMPPARLLWRVKTERSPVAELGDLVDQLRRAGVEEQGLWAPASAATTQERHLGSWRNFAARHQLTWVAGERQ